MRTFWAVALLPLVIVATFTAASPAVAGSPRRHGFDSHLQDDHADLDAWSTYGHSDPTRKSKPVTYRRPATLTAYAPACPGNVPKSPTNLGTLCSGAVLLCANTADPDDRAYWVFTAPSGPPTPGPDDWRNTGLRVCRGPGAAGVPGRPPVVVTVADFRRLPLPAGQIRVQPPNGRTLVNVPTNLFTQAATLTIPTTVLGQPVQVRATARVFRWSYGDRLARATADPGAPYPNLSTAHTYLLAGSVTVQLATVYEGEFSVAGQPWQPIDGTATVASPPAALTVLEARSHLVTDPLP